MSQHFTRRGLLITHPLHPHKAITAFRDRGARPIRYLRASVLLQAVHVGVLAQLQTKNLLLRTQRLIWCVLCIYYATKMPTLVSSWSTCE